MSKAVYPGSFDPITNGHIDIAKRAIEVFDNLVILIAVNPMKKTLFTGEERKKMVEEVFKDYDNITVEISSDLTVNTAKKLEATHIVRGLRAVTDFEYEFQINLTNRKISKGIDSVFFMTDNKYSYLSSTTVKEIAMFDGEVSWFVPKNVEDELYKKFH
jgi:pantetheine-phosphate adenylyltransferase